MSYALFSMGNHSYASRMACLQEIGVIHVIANQLLKKRRNLPSQK